MKPNIADLILAKIHQEDPELYEDIKQELIKKISEMNQTKKNDKAQNQST